MPEVSKPTVLQALGDKRMTAVLLLSFASGSTVQFDRIHLASVARVRRARHQDHRHIRTWSAFRTYVKFLWAPLLDRYLPPLLGRRRGWILIYQACLAIAIGVMGFCSPIKEPYVLGIIALLVAFLSASQDIVVDAYRVDVIPPSERALAAAATTFGFRSAAMLAGTVLVLIAAWPRTPGGHFCCVALRVPAGGVRHGGDDSGDGVGAGTRCPRPAAADPGGCRVAALAGMLIKQKGALGFLLLVLLYKVGDAFALSLYSAFMIKGVGFSLAELSLYGKVNMTVSTMIGVSIGGMLVHTLGNVSVDADIRHRSGVHQSSLHVAGAGRQEDCGCWCLRPAWTRESAAWARRHSSPSWCPSAVLISARLSTRCCRR